MKKEAVNTFSEGLVMDLNPLTTPSNVMTSCLNGTIITYNGNEFVLQNDMGNGRVETAYLPAGYVPIGIKEHGGIIYVASYNPLTNKGQIGSFPSPERNISSNEINQIAKVIDPSSFDNDGSFSTTYKLNLFDGSDNLVLRSGDKFSIVVSGGSGPNDLKKYISNYLNVEGDKVTSPKNKALTLKACIIDANNNLRDITPQLKRIDVNGSNYPVLEFDESDSQLFKENSGFYALPSKFDLNMDLDEHRKNKALNVYNNKVFGELCIVATLNTIQRIDFSILGSKDGDVANLQLMMTYYYNCPDGFFDYTNKEERYRDLYNRYSTIYGRSADFADKNLIKGYRFSIQDVADKPVDFSIKDINDVEYLESENLYKVTNVYDLPPITIKDQNSDIREFSAVPAMTYAELPGLTASGTINLAKLGSGEINLNNWRYYCTEDVVTLTWGFEAYLKAGQIIEDLQFQLYDAETKTNTYTYSPTRKYSYNGVFTDVLGYQEGLEYQKLYLVIIKCKLNTLDKSKNKEVRTFARWLLTTSLYNEQYFGMGDYSKFTKDQLHNTTNFTGLNDIDFDISYELKEVSNEPSTTLEPYSPNLVSQDDQIIMGYRINSKVMQIAQSLQYKGAINYPFSIPEGRYTAQYTVDPNSSTVEWNGILGGMGEIPESVHVDQVSNNLSDWTSETFDVKTNVLLASIAGQDRVLIRYKAPSFILGKKFDSVKQILYTKVLSNYGNRMESILGGKIQSDTTPPFAIQLVFREKQLSGPADHHGYGYFPIQYNNGWEFLRNPFDYIEHIARCSKDGSVTYHANKDWTNFVTNGIKEVMGFNPILIFMTFYQATNEIGDYFSPQKGHFRLPHYDIQTPPVNIRSIALWFNGQDYGMINGYSTSLKGSDSMLAKIQTDLSQLYIRQAGEVAKESYLVDPAASSYVSGGSFKVSTTIKASLKADDSVKMLPPYLLDINATVSDINTKSGGKLESEQIEELARLMTFSVNEDAILDIPIQFQDQLADMQPTFSSIQLLSDNPIIDTPAIIDGDTIYQQDSKGLAISEFQIYTKINGTMQAINTTSGTLQKYASAFNVKDINGNEYHLIPRTLTIGSPKIDASAGSGDSRTTLNFNGIKMINLSLGKSLI